MTFWFLIFKEIQMNNINIFSYVIADHQISDVKMEIYFAPAVLDAFYSKKDVLTLSKESREKQEALNDIINIIEGQVKKYNTYEIWYDLIDYKGIELVWKSKFVEDEKAMYVEVLYSRGNHPEEETTH